MIGGGRPGVEISFSRKLPKVLISGIKKVLRKGSHFEGYKVDPWLFMTFLFPVSWFCSLEKSLRQLNSHWKGWIVFTNKLKLIVDFSLVTNLLVLPLKYLKQRKLWKTNYLVSSYLCMVYFSVLHLLIIFVIFSMTFFPGTSLMSRKKVIVKNYIHCWKWLA